jgi:group I intron endonuclease
MERKTLTNEYKNQKQPAGVFQIQNTVNGKIYLDTSLNLDKIWNRHCFELNFGSHRNAALQQDWKTFGEQAFVFEILYEIEQKEGETLDLKRELKSLEQLYLEELKPFGERGYHTQK